MVCVGVLIGVNDGDNLDINDYMRHLCNVILDIFGDTVRASSYLSISQNLYAESFNECDSLKQEI